MVPGNLNRRRNRSVCWHMSFLSDAVSSSSSRCLVGLILGALIIGRKESVSQDRFALSSAGLSSCNRGAIGCQDPGTQV